MVVAGSDGLRRSWSGPAVVVGKHGQCVQQGEHIGTPSGARRDQSLEKRLPTERHVSGRAEWETDLTRPFQRGFGQGWGYCVVMNSRCRTVGMPLTAWISHVRVCVPGRIMLHPIEVFRVTV